MILVSPAPVGTCSDWQVEGSWTEWDYAITSPSQGLVAAIGKELFNWTDTYVSSSTPRHSPAAQFPADIHR